ncbi:MAG TPA: DUF1156 domain-containing protein [Verrucomicrobiae bacterium]|nr:DUF1156 domain-containing protein [Verrucomicrobiae bacterium]
MIERDFDTSFVANLALREKQIQQNYRPVIAVHKWFARRPGTLFRALILSEFCPDPLRDAFYQGHNLQGIRIADPFMGGGTPLIEANRLGCDVFGCDINPMAYWIVHEVIDHLDIGGYRAAAERLRTALAREVGHLYRTRCSICGSVEAHVKYFLWVKILTCESCAEGIDLFPGYLLAQDVRHPRNVIVCSHCGNLNETASRQRLGSCADCGEPLLLTGSAQGNRCKCPHCDVVNTYPNPKAGPPRHRLFAIEYVCTGCRAGHDGRFFKKPDADDLRHVDESEAAWKKARPLFAPTDTIPRGDETDRLHRWGYTRYSEMFNARQLLGLELSCRFIARQADRRIRQALATNLSDLLRYQNMLCRYDTMALKSLDVFSVHGFPVGLIQCESNLLGIPNGHRGGSVGSGGWSNTIEKYAKAKTYCDNPFEIRHQHGRKIIVPVDGEWIGDHHNSRGTQRERKVELRCQSASAEGFLKGKLDAVLTDPPYFGNVQYAELMDFCYVWLRKLVGEATPGFDKPSTRRPDELTANTNMRRGLDCFTEGLSGVFRKMTDHLKKGAPFAFTYHHNRVEAYLPVAVAILDSGLVCSATLVCPAEMGASIHISGTGSSIIDTVFVCRSTGFIPRRLIVDSAHALAVLVQEDVANLETAGVKATQGDIRCVIFGHLARLAVWHLRQSWDKSRQVSERLALIARYIEQFGGFSAVLDALTRLKKPHRELEYAAVRESRGAYLGDKDEIPF